VEQDPAELESLNRRLADLADLRRKYGDTLDDVLTFGRQAASRAGEIGSLLQRAASLDDELAAAEEAVASVGERLGAARRSAAKLLAEGTAAHLRDLGFDDPVVAVDVQPADRAGPHGCDRVELRFASDASLPVGPVSRIASGGELSRLVLAIRLAGGIAEAPVLAFDEVDAGVGGATALAMGEKLARLAEGRQILVVTHLPQVAAFADTHLVVDRADGTATVRRLSGGDRVAELSRMLGGLPESLRGREHAEELIELAAGTAAGG
jgi:DNA repair protein RecN (Recombination protein N)